MTTVRGNIMQRRNVGVFKKANRNGSFSFYLRWSKMDGTNNTFSERVVRTSPKPTKKELRQCEAEAWSFARVKEQALNEGANEYLIKCDMITAGDRYIHEMDGHLADSTVDRLCRVLPKFVRYLRRNGCDKQVHTLMPHRVARYRDWLLEQGMNASTVCCYLSDISGWLSWCVRESYCTDNFASRARVNYPIRNDDGVTTRLALEGAEDYWRLIGNLKTDYEVAVVGFLACSGLRIGEAAEMQWWQWERSADQAGTVAVAMRERRTKKHNRTFPVCNVLSRYLLMLSMWNDEGPFIIGADYGVRPITSQVRSMLRPWGCSPHDLRRWFRTALETTSPRVAWDLIDDIMGHRASKTRRAYTRQRNIEAYRPILDRFSAWLLDAKTPLRRPS
jgi:integrase